CDLSTSAKSTPSEREEALTTEDARALAMLLDGQAALRRIAMLVARQSSPEVIFGAVAETIGSLLGADLSSMVAFEDGAGSVVATWSRDGPVVPIGTRVPLDNDTAVARVFQSGTAVRVDSYSDAWAVDLARSLGVRSTVGAPILVDGKLWGAVAAAVRG